jgi:hypothetical protein
MLLRGEERKRKGTKKKLEKKEWKKRRGRRSQSTPVCDEVVVTAKNYVVSHGH